MQNPNSLGQCLVDIINRDMKKEIKITQISVVLEAGYQTSTVYGLGEDNKIYVWMEKSANWCLYKLK